MNGIETSSYIWDLFRVLFALGAVVVLIILFRRYGEKFLLGKGGLNEKSGGELEIKQRIPMGVKKQLVVAKMRDEVLLLAVNDGDISLLKSFPEGKGDLSGWAGEGTDYEG